MKKSIIIGLLTVGFFTLFPLSVNAQTLAPAADNPFIGHHPGHWRDGKTPLGPKAEITVRPESMDYHCDPCSSWGLRGADFKNLPYKIREDGVLVFKSPTSGKDFIFKRLPNGKIQGNRSDDPVSNWLSD